MKNLSLAFLFLLCSCSTVNYTASQSIQKPTQVQDKTAQQLLNFTLKQSSKLSKEELHQLSLAWAHTFLLDPASAITYTDSNTGTIIGKYKSTNELDYINTFKIISSAGSIVISISNPVNKEGKSPINRSLSPERAALILADWQNTSSNLFYYINSTQN